MKIDFDAKKIKEFYFKIRIFLPFVGIFIIFVIFVVLSYLAIFPKEDLVLKAEGEARVRELEINFNAQTLNKLNSTSTPSQITGIGGRNPFNPF